MSEIGVSREGFAKDFKSVKNMAFAVLHEWSQIGMVKTELRESGWNGENSEEEWGKNSFVESVY